jgi:hypothetical protein
MNAPARDARVIYPVEGIPGKTVTVRFVAEVSPELRAEAVSDRRITNEGVIIYDSEGVVWASEVEVDGEYVAFTTHRGTLLLSFRPFQGAEDSGIAQGRKIVLRMKDYPKIVIQGLGEFVPTGSSAKVFVRYVKERRSGGLNTVTVLESSDEKKLLARLK